MSARQSILVTILVLLSVGSSLALVLFLREWRRPIQGAPIANTSRVVAPPPERISYAQCLDERDADTVMVVTIDIPNVAVGKRIELPIKQVREHQLASDAGSFSLNEDGLNGDGMNTSLFIVPDFGSASSLTVNLNVSIAWSTHGERGAIDRIIPVVIGKARLLDLPHATRMKIEFRPPK